MFKGSRYTSSPSGWSGDLEKSIEYYDIGYRVLTDHDGKPYLDVMRYANDTYCEIGRLSNRHRTHEILFGVVVLLGTLFFAGAFISASIVSITTYHNPLAAVLFFCIVMPAFVMAFYFLHIKSVLILNLLLPEDIPIRFNRQTGKVYVYDPQLNKNYITFPWKVLKNMAKPDIKVFEWDNLSAFKRRAGLVGELWLAACKPGTNDVIDYFLVNNSPAGEDEWLWLMEYMSFSRQLSYQSYLQPRHWVHKLNRRFAPAIIWPEGIDKASKACSKEELAQIEQLYGLVDKIYPEYIIDLA